MRGGAKESQRKRGRKRAKVTDGKKDNSVVFVTPPYVEYRSEHQCICAANVTRDDDESCLLGKHEIKILYTKR